MIGFNFLLLYAALSLQFKCVCVYFAYTVHILCVCVWGKSIKGNKAIDRVRVNGFKIVGTNCKDLIQSGG